MAQPFDSVQSASLFSFCFFILLFYLDAHGHPRLEAKVSKAAFGSTPESNQGGKFYTLEGRCAEGAHHDLRRARLVSLEVPDRSGRAPATSCSATNLWAGYTADPKSYFGSIVGRYGQQDRPREFYPRRQGVPSCLPTTALTPCMAESKASTRLVWHGACDFRMESSSPL